MKVLNDLAKSGISRGQNALLSWTIFFRHQPPDITLTSLLNFSPGSSSRLRAWASRQEPHRAEWRVCPPPQSWWWEAPPWSCWGWIVWRTLSWRSPLRGRSRRSTCTDLEGKRVEERGERGKNRVVLIWRLRTISSLNCHSVVNFKTKHRYLMSHLEWTYKNIKHKNWKIFLQ